MAKCEQFRLQLILHLDGELDDAEVRPVEAHLRSCARCRTAFNRERMFRAGLHKRRPLYRAPDALRHRVEALVNEAQAAPPSEEPPSEARASAPAHSPATARLRRRQRHRQLVRLLRRSTAAVLIAGMVLATGIWVGDGAVTPAGAASFASMAVGIHQRHASGQLPLDITTDTPQEISDWFKGKVSFDVTLPNYRDTFGNYNRYAVKGARLVSFDGSDAAYVAFALEEHPVSLAVTSTNAASPSGGRVISSKGIDFHYESIDGLKVISWSHRALTYALVSDLKDRGQQSCMVCHQDKNDRDLIDSLSFLDGAMGATPGDSSATSGSLHE